MFLSWEPALFWTLSLALNKCSFVTDECFFFNRFAFAYTLAFLLHNLLTITTIHPPTHSPTHSLSHSWQRRMNLSTTFSTSNTVVVVAPFHHSDRLITCPYKLWLDNSKVGVIVFYVLNCAAVALHACCPRNLKRGYITTTTFSRNSGVQFSIFNFANKICSRDWTS